MNNRDIFKPKTRSGVVIPAVFFLLAAGSAFYLRHHIYVLYQHANFGLTEYASDIFLDDDIDVDQLKSQLNTMRNQLASLKNQVTTLTEQANQLKQLEKSLRIPPGKHNRFVANIKLRPNMSYDNHDRYEILTNISNLTDTFIAKGDTYFGKSTKYEKIWQLVTIYDAKSTVPVVIGKHKIATSINGQGTSKLPISVDIPDFNDIKIGDLVYTRQSTSFPGNLLVGKIVEIVPNYENRSYKVLVKPAANYANATYAQLIRQSS